MTTPSEPAPPPDASGDPTRFTDEDFADAIRDAAELADEHLIDEADREEGFTETTIGKVARMGAARLLILTDENRRLHADLAASERHGNLLCEEMAKQAEMFSGKLREAHDDIASLTAQRDAHQGLALQLARIVRCLEPNEQGESCGTCVVCTALSRPTGEPET